MQAAREVEEQREVPSRIGSDRDDVILGLSARVGAEVIGVDAERDELDPRATVAQPGSQLVDLAPAVRDDRVQATKRLAEESSRGRAAKLLEALRQSDRRVHHRRAHATEPTEERERDADRVDGREDDVGTVQLAKRRDDAREVARVSAAQPNAPIEDAGNDPRAAARLEFRLEIVTNPEACSHQLVETVEAVARRIADRSTKRLASQRGVPVEHENAWWRGPVDHVG